MREALIVGSGPAAVGAALALSSAGVVPTVVDIGTRLETVNQLALDRLRRGGPEEWRAEDVSVVAAQPVESIVDGLPEKRAYGSNFVFRDVGQLDGIRAEGGAHRSVVSGAYGGFSNVWGSQLMPFTADTLADWPGGACEMRRHYTAILDEVPLAGRADDLSQSFPLFVEPRPLPLQAERTAMVLERYDRRREAIQARGITVGHARLAMSPSSCVRCGLCMTGCPYGLIYSASHSMDRLRARGAVRYLPHMLALRIEEDRGRPRLKVRDLRSNRILVLESERIFVACGALGTTRLVASSLGLFGRTLQAQESAQFTVPVLSLRGTSDPRRGPRFTLNQFNMVMHCGDNQRDLVQMHFYTHNDAVTEALPGLLRVHRLEVPRREVLKRLTVGIGYLPSWASPALAIRFEEAGDQALAGMVLTRERFDWRMSSMLRRVKQQMRSVASDLDLWPLFRLAIYAAGGKTYHFGGTFPYGIGPQELQTDEVGRLAPFANVHLVDASVFPSVPATTFTFTIMANAHRVASHVSGAALGGSF